MTTYRIDNQRRIEPVDLQPYGNTISVEAPSDNPFEDAQDIDVYTQMSGGMAGPDKRQRSKRILTNPPKERIQHAGRVKAIHMRAPAHKQHAGFIPGLAALGAEVYGPPAPTSDPSTASQVFSAISSGVQTAGQVASQKFAADAAAAQARQADAQARQQQSLTERMGMQNMFANVGAHKGVSGTLVVVAGVAVVGAILLFAFKKKGKK